MALGDLVSLVPERTSASAGVLPFPQPGVIRDLRAGNQVFIADGSVWLEVVEANGSEVKAVVRNGGAISSFKGVNLPGVAIDPPVLTPEDEAALRFGLDQEVDWVAVSLVRSAEDIQYARDSLNRIDSNALLMAKLEGAEGVANLDSILARVDGVMVARGDMDMELPMERVPVIQKEIALKASRSGKVSAIATQMLLSMVLPPSPTRAKVSDVTNAVLDGCDAIMLSDETAVGKYPIEAARVADATIREAETIYPYHKDLDSHGRTQAVAAAADGLVRSLGVQTGGDHQYRAGRFRSLPLPAGPGYHRLLP